MKKKIIILLLLAVSAINGFSQIKFEKGYFIDNSDKKNEVLIKNIDWKSNPTEFEYKISETASIQTITIKDIKEYGVYNFSKHKRFTVNIDRSSERNNKISFERNPVFKEETLLLKELVHGDADLYLYSFGDLRRYFYSVNGSKLKQLVYKTYFLPEGAKDRLGDKVEVGVDTGVNESYKQQLVNDLPCNTLSLKDAKKVEHRRKSLVNYFIKYNQCKNPSEVKNWDEGRAKNLFSISIRPGFNMSKYSVIDTNTNSSYNVDFDAEFSFRLGVEAEYVFPFNKNKWAIFMEPTYQYYNTEKEVIINPNTFFERKSTYITDYKSIDVPVGIRYYSFFNDESKMFFNVAYVVNFDLKKSIILKEREFAVDGKGANYNFAFGIGYTYKNKFSIELRQGAARNILNAYSSIGSKYTTTSLILGYTFFNK